MMRVKTLILTVVALAFLMNCEGSLTSTDNTVSDNDLISSIQKSTSRESIEVQQLPVASKRLLSSEYGKYEPVQAIIAHKHGYEVVMQGLGEQYGDTDVVYFDLDGRKLNGDQALKHRWGRKGRGGERCFDIVFPITLIMPDASTITLDSAADRSLVRDWFEANPEVTEKPSHQFPIDIVMDDSLITLNSEEELIELRETCRELNGGREKCFTFVLPVSFTMPDGTTLTIETEDDHGSLRDWRKENPDVEGRPELVFPVTIIYPDGTELEITNSEEMGAVREDCGGTRRPHPGRRHGGGR